MIGVGTDRRATVLKPRSRRRRNVAFASPVPAIGPPIGRGETSPAAGDHRDENQTAHGRRIGPARLRRSGIRRRRDRAAADRPDARHGAGRSRRHRRAGHAQPHRRRRADPVLRPGLFPAVRAADGRRRPEARALGHLPVGRAGIGRRADARFGLGLYADPDQRRAGSRRQPGPLVLRGPHPRRTDRAGRSRSLFVGQPLGRCGRRRHQHRAA